jgi:hypothetical protein
MESTLIRVAKHRASAIFRTPYSAIIWPRNVRRNVRETVGAVEWCRDRRDKETDPPSSR